MSEKRFKSTIDEETMSIMPYLVYDNEEECFYNLKDCVDLLNELSTSCRQLETEVKTQNDYLMNKGLTEDYSEWKKME